LALAAVTQPEHAEAIRRVYPRVLAKLLGLTRSLADAEDAVQDAVERALQSWCETGAPASAEAWLITVAQNAYRDRLRQAKRKEKHGDAVETLAELSPWARIAVAEAHVLSGWKDALLGLLFACCHPALEEGESAALALSTVVGLSIGELAQAFVVAPRSMEQRLTRARQRLRERGDVEGTLPERARDRLGAVLRAVHLLFNEGYWSSTDDAPIRAELCRLAVGLTGSLVEAFPDDAEALGLLALLLFHDARRDARLDEAGNPVPLPEQKRTRWDYGAIQRATELLEHALSLGRPGPFQTEAAIAAVHCRAPSADATEWAEIAALYALLERFRPTPAVRVNRCFAVAKAEGAEMGLALLERDDGIDVRGYPYFHLVRGAILEELGRFEEARASLLRAVERARNVHEAEHVRARIARLENGEGVPVHDPRRSR
jgi:RNA polymerase sigma-70 factor (ECF subfamily)